MDSVINSFIQFTHSFHSFIRGTIVGNEAQSSATAGSSSSATTELDGEAAGKEATDGVFRTRRGEVCCTNPKKSAVERLSGASMPMKTKKQLSDKVSPRRVRHQHDYHHNDHEHDMQLR